ncbi:nicotinamide-nucleotide amidase [Brevibacterium sanguinis]|uniref:Nicotinamide-nucleotide amidase n=2 Tax=Brevibacterium TaxID=1696 RepID=A0A366IKT8_9MICO|nr:MULTISPECIES: CinA family protein [Brevibacterium]RBP66187.1 nicotinamide-nucleotide amidase [Brevibacterium sanguinis]RBP72838.1 nicotinamide-nucleotide amidase [Brevibacterium celere]
MTSNSEKLEERAAQTAARLSELCIESGLRAAVAESLTGGKIAGQFAAAPDSGTWFAGGVVAYSSDVKHTLLEVPAGPVISQQAVETMVRSVARIMGADVAVAASGSGGPEEQEGQEPGTTWIAVLVGDEVCSEIHHFDGEPIDILAQTEDRALTLVTTTLEKHLHRGDDEDDSDNG